VIQMSGVALTQVPRPSMVTAKPEKVRVATLSVMAWGPRLRAHEGASREDWTPRLNVGAATSAYPRVCAGSPRAWAGYRHRA
jgi:hypothetical protein